MATLTELASKVPDKERFPVAIIGAGLGGLMAGACLARNGFPVTVFERYDKPGGYATTFSRGAFTFDVSLHATVAAGPPVDFLLEASGVKNRIEPVLLPELARFVTPGRPDLSYPRQEAKNLLPNDPTNYVKEIIASFVARFPDDAQGIQAFFGKMMQLLQVFLKEGMAGLEKDPLSKISLSEFLDECTGDPWLKTLLGGFISYYGKTPKTLPASFYLFSTGGLITCGSWYYKRRSQDFSNAFVDVIREHGGKVVTGAEVTDVLMEGEEVSGVVCQTGGDKRKEAAKAVISNACVPETMFKLLPAGKVPQDYREKLGGLKPSMSMVNIWLGLNRDISTDIPAYETFVFDSCDDAANLQAINACDPERMPYGVTVYNNAYQGYAPPGTSIVSIFARSSYEPWRAFEVEYRTDHTQASAYKKRKNHVRDVLIQRAEKQVIPGLSAMIREKEAATPLTNLRFTGNAQGAFLGYSQLLGNSGGSRLKNTCPVEGLYLASAWGTPGGGYFGVLNGGYDAVCDLLKDLQP